MRGAAPVEGATMGWKRRFAERPVRGRPGWGLALVLVLVLGAGCDDAPAVSTINPRLDALWPNEDGRQWIFATTFRVWGPEPAAPFLFPHPDSVPPAPSLDVIVETLDAGFQPPEPFQEIAADYTFLFDGNRITRSGVEAQNLFAQLAVAGRPPGTGIPFSPVLLHGGAFAKTTRWIGTYGDLDTLAAWKFLDRSLRPGHTFHYQLLRALNDETFLHARVFPRQTVVTPAGTYADAVEVVYLVDHGRGFRVTGDAYGYFRVVTFGNVVYAPGVGPVRSYERRFAPVGRNLGNGESDATSVLVDVQPGPGEP